MRGALLFVLMFIRVWHFIYIMFLIYSLFGGIAHGGRRYSHAVCQWIFSRGYGTMMLPKTKGVIPMFQLEEPIQLGQNE